jgi:hypothetical protein
MARVFVFRPRRAASVTEAARLPGDSTRQGLIVWLLVLP